MNAGELAAPFHQLPFKKAAIAVGVVAGKTLYFSGYCSLDGEVELRVHLFNLNSHFSHSKLKEKKERSSDPKTMEIHLN